MNRTNHNTDNMGKLFPEVTGQVVTVLAPPRRDLAPHSGISSLRSSTSPSSASLRFVAEFIPQSGPDTTRVMLYKIFTITAKSAPSRFFGKKAGTQPPHIAGPL